MHNLLRSDRTFFYAAIVSILSHLSVIGAETPRQPRSLPEGARAFRNLSYVTNGHERHKLDVFLPAQGTNWPLIVWIHGGAWLEGNKESCPALPFLAQGYAVASINYRLSQHAIFPAQLQDCKAAIRWLRAQASQYGYDAGRIGVWGSSAGGHLVALLGTTGDVKEFEVGENLHLSSRVQAVVDFFGPTDFTRMNAQAGAKGVMDHDATNSPESKLIGCPVQENKDKASKANPITFISPGDAPFLICHGDRDYLVAHGQSVLLHAALTAAGAESTFITVTNAGHGWGRRPEVDSAVAEFFSKHLKAPIGGNWPRWRGPQDHGSVEVGVYPAKLQEENILWKAPLPGKGCSTPIVWNNRIYLTAPTNGLDAVLAFGASGELLWQTTLSSEKPGKHRNGSGSNPSPVTDGQGLFVYFKSGTLAALDLAGNVRWQTNLVATYGPDTLYWDHGTSPVLTEKYVIMARMHHGESWLAAFDKVTGELCWKVARNYETPTEGDHGYNTPLVIQHGGKEALLVWGGEHLTAHDTADGHIFWSCGDFNPKAMTYWPAVASPVIAGDMAVVPTGRNDRGQPRLHGIRLGGSGDVTATHRVWLREDTGTFVPSPALYKGRVYLVRDRGEVECLDPATGKTLWTGAFPKTSSNFYASPLVAGGILYAPREDGVVFVARVEDRFELLSENDMGERIIASPVPVSPNRLLIRGEKHLFCIAAQ